MFLKLEYTVTLSCFCAEQSCVRFLKWHCLCSGVLMFFYCICRRTCRTTQSNAGFIIMLLEMFKVVDRVSIPFQV